jgi:ferrochelatase
MSTRKIGVLVMSYGTPESMDRIEAYYTHIRRGVPPSPEQLAKLKARYEAIVGGFFPLRENTNRQVYELERTLNRLHPDRSFRCYQGLKHAPPFIEDGVRQMAEDGVRDAVGVVLAPHYSAMSVGSYIGRAREAAASLGLNIRFVKSYHLHPKLIRAWSERVERALSRFEADGVEKKRVRVIFTAHSLPEKILEMRDPYPDQLRETSKAVAERAGVTNWQFAWQSAGETGTPWLGPDILDVLETIRREERVDNALICPIGFVSDHLEILYDIDIECKRKAASLGMRLERTEMLNADPLYMETLSDAIVEQLA